MKIYFGKETKKAIKNFPFSLNKVPVELITAMAEIKLVAALANTAAGILNQEKSAAIVKAAEEIIDGKHTDQFILPYLQGGAGTSINTNINEVIACRAEELLHETGKPQKVHPNDHVNMSQSTNDVSPSALRIASIRLATQLLQKTSQLILTLALKAEEFKSVVKLGRTHLQDAVPTTLGAEFQAYVAILKNDKSKLEAFLPYFYAVNLGGTAIGNSINSPKTYIDKIYELLPKVTNLSLIKSDNFMAQISSQSDFLSLSQAITVLMMDLSKIASDLRYMASGPTGGLGEISLPELQAGSTIMPGKINPVIPETVNQIYFLVSGNNVIIEQAAQAAELELGIMFPLVGAKLIESLKVATDGIEIFNNLCLKEILANKKRCQELLEKSNAYAVLLTPKFGFDQVNQLVKEAQSSGKTLKELVVQKRLLTREVIEQIFEKQGS